MAHASQVLPVERSTALPQLVSAPRLPKRRFNVLQLYRLVTLASLLMCGFVLLIMHQQDRTIQQQRQLIRELYRDSVELKNIKMREAQTQHQAKPQTQQKHSQRPRRQASRMPMMDGCVRGICGSEALSNQQSAL